MKVLVVAAVILGVALAAPNNKGLKFRSLYKDPLGVPKAHQPSGRIINGEIAEPHSIPYQVFLEVYSANGGGWYCGGSLISETVVLTAGHCGYEGYQASVTLGAQKPLDTEDSQVIVNSNDFVVHEEFDMDTISNDIALIRLPTPVELNDAIQLVSLPTAADINKTYAGETAQVSGWGLTDGEGNSLSDELRYTQNEIISNEECSNVFGFKIPDYQICLSGANGHSTCSGDSGGPLTVDGVEVGVVSYVIGKCLPGYPTAYTRTTSFVDWIIKNSSP